MGHQGRGDELANGEGRIDGRPRVAPQAGMIGVAAQVFANEAQPSLCLHVLQRRFSADTSDQALASERRASAQGKGKSQHAPPASSVSPMYIRGEGWRAQVGHGVDRNPSNFRAKAGSFGARARIRGRCRLRYAACATGNDVDVLAAAPPVVATAAAKEKDPYDDQDNQRASAHDFTSLQTFRGAVALGERPQSLGPH